MTNGDLFLSGPVQPSDDRAALLAQIERGELTTTLTGVQLRTLAAEADRALSATAGVPSTLRHLLGPELHGIAAHLKFFSDVGAGHLRHVRDVIAALRRARAKMKGKR
jgi:hypothetical protein